MRMNSPNALSGAAAAPDAGSQYLTFLLGGQEYALDILRVQEIRSWGPVTKLPAAPPHVLGVMNLRGVLVPLLDLRVRFGMGDASCTPTTAVIVVRSGERTVGLVVDEVREVYQLADAAIQEPVGRDAGLGVSYLRGVATVGEQTIIVLSLDEVVGFGFGAPGAGDHA